MKKLAVVGANDFQNQLIIKAKELGYETFVFAWEDGAVGKDNADYFFPISIVEKELILEKCREIGIDGICSIASDLAVVTVDYVAEKLGLNANSIECSEISTNKFKMRTAFRKNNDPIPRYTVVSEMESYDAAISELSFPLIVKPTDRSGSRGVTKISSVAELPGAVAVACEKSFEHKAMVEEFVEGKEYSVECVSFHGKHTLLAVTEKITTGAPHFIETGHNQPAHISGQLREKIRTVVFHALGSLKIKEGASHSEIKIDDAGEIKIIEIGSRMGGGCIGSDLVRITTGVDFTKMVIDIALNNAPDFRVVSAPREACVRFVLKENDMVECEEMLKRGMELERKCLWTQFDNRSVVDSSGRYGYYVMKGDAI